MKFKENESLAHYSTFRIGGPAKLFVEVATVADLVEAFERAEKEHLPIFVFSGGSNILFSDRGFPGVVARIGIGGLQVRPDGTVSVGAGEKLSDLVAACCAAGLSGIERLSGVPGSVGGAVRGNAGAFGAEFGNVVTRVKTFHRRTGEIREIDREECRFGYRTSGFKEDPDLVVLSAELALSSGHDSEELCGVADDIREKRENRHPQDIFSAGSFFMNPVVTDEDLREEFARDAGKPPKDERLPAGWLIDQVGLRGRTIGHAKISEIHPNYVLNTGGATAEEVLMLVSIVKQKVRDELNVQLREEVQLVGFGTEEPL